MAKNTHQVIDELMEYLNKTTDIIQNPLIDVIVNNGELGEEVIVSSKGQFVGIRPEEGSKGRRFVINVYYGTDDDRLPREERMKDGSRVVQGNDYLYWSHDESFLGKLLYSKADKLKADNHRKNLIDLLDQWIEEVHLN